VADEETELMLRVAAGDERAFERLVGLVLPRLLGYFRRLGADRASAAGARLAGGELAGALEAAIASLGEEHREVFLLAQVDGLRYQEIGEILGIPVGTVKSRVFSAVREIRAWLGARGIEP
jgi:DNA-directed RNA polymerase specialized sigma24 family protein